MEQDFRRIFTMLPPGGLFIQKTPAIAGMWYLKPIIGGMALIGKAPKTLRYLTGEEVDGAMRKAGFEILESGPLPAGSSNHFVVARKPV